MFCEEETNIIHTKMSEIKMYFAKRYKEVNLVHGVVVSLLEFSLKIYRILTV